MIDKEELKSMVKKVESNMPCRCDLDNWEPEISTGHSIVCPIYREIEKELKGVSNEKG